MEGPAIFEGYFLVEYLEAEEIKALKSARGTEKCTDNTINIFQLAWLNMSNCTLYFEYDILSILFAQFVYEQMNGIE